MTIKVAACQVPDIRENFDESLGWIEKFTKQAEEKDVSIICFPECFLQGYLTDEPLSKKYAVNLISETFKTMLHRLIKYILRLTQWRVKCFYDGSVQGSSFE